MNSSRARMMYMRARDVAIQPVGAYNPMAVKALVGIARTHRMQYTMDPESLDSQQAAHDEVTGRDHRQNLPRVARAAARSRPHRPQGGRRPRSTCLRSTPNPPPDLMTMTLIELGDWFQSTSRPVVSLPYYAEAAGIFDAQAANDPLAGNPLRAPRMVFYRPPVSASRGLNTLSGHYVILKTVFTLRRDRYEACRR